MCVRVCVRARERVCVRMCACVCGRCDLRDSDLAICFKLIFCHPSYLIPSISSDGMSVLQCVAVCCSMLQCVAAI